MSLTFGYRTIPTVTLPIPKANRSTPLTASPPTGLTFGAARGSLPSNASHVEGSATSPLSSGLTAHHVVLGLVLLGVLGLLAHAAVQSFTTAVQPLSQSSGVQSNPPASVTKGGDSYASSTQASVTPALVTVGSSVDPKHKPKPFSPQNYAQALVLLEFSSSAAKLQIMGQPTEGGPLVPLLKVRCVTQLKHNLSAGSRTIEQITEQYRRVASILKDEIDPFKQVGVPLNTMAIATGPYRTHPELKPLLDNLDQTLGTHTKVVNGLEEGKLFYQGVYANFVERHPEAKDKNVLMVDMGGASTELILANNPTHETATHSLNLGEGSMSGQYDGFKKEDFNAIRTMVKDRIVQDLGEKRRVFDHPDYVVWDYKPHLNLLTDLVYVDSSNDTKHKLNAYQDSIDKKTLDRYTADDKALRALERRSMYLSHAHENRLGYERDKVENLPVLMAIMLGVLDATGAEAIHIRQYEGIPMGMAKQLMPEATFNGHQIVKQREWKV
jgi:Ppx/GppA phosphatase family